MREALLVSFVATLGCGTAAAQQVLPAGSEKIVSRHSEELLLPRRIETPVRLQHIYDAADFVKPSGTLTEIAFRRNDHYAATVVGGRVLVTVRIGYGDLDVRNPSTTFSYNMVQTPSQSFFSGYIDYPAAPQQPGPATFTHVIKATNPMAFTPHGTGIRSICVETRTTTSDFAFGNRRLDAVSIERGGRRSNGASASSCRFSNNDWNGALGYRTSGLSPAGGSWFVVYQRIPQGTVGVSVLSFRGVDRPGIWPLPIDLGKIGAPGCSWNVGLETGIYMPMVANAAREARVPDLPIPATLGGWSFFDQALFFDAGANAAGLVSSWSSEWYVSNGDSMRGATLYRRNNNQSQPTAEYATTRQVAICRFRY